MARRASGHYRGRESALPAMAIGMIATAVVVLVLTPLGMVVAGPGVIGDAVRAVDRALIDLATEPGPTVVDAVARTMSATTDTWTVIGVSVGCLTVLAVERRWWQFTLMVVSPLVELGSFLLVTFLVARDRPASAPEAAPTTGSFPSGHAAMSVALYVALAVVIGSRTRRDGLRRGVLIGGGALAALVGLSRVRLGFHYPSDVLVGWLLGLTALGVGVLAADAVVDHRSNGRADAERPSEPPRSRRVLTVAAAIVTVVGIWGVVIEPRALLVEQRESARIPELPTGWDGATVAVVTDLQIGMWLDNEGMARRAIETARDERPDVALLLGDFVYGGDDVARHVESVTRIVRPLTDAGVPTYAVLGNHDHAAGAVPLLRSSLAAIGVSVLENEAVALRAANGDVLHLVGIGAALPGAAEPVAAIDEVPPRAPRIVMMHNPVSFGGLPAGSAPVAVAGHTHGGQVRFPFLPAWSWLGLLEDHPVHTDGWIDDYGEPGNRLFVSRGIGMSRIPVRINATPVVTFLELHGGP